MASLASVFSCPFTQYPWQHWAEQTPDAICLWLNDGAQTRAITWHQLCCDIATVPLCLASVTYQEGNQRLQGYIALDGANHYSTLLYLLAAWQQGIATLLINPAFSPELRQQILTQTGIEHCVDPVACSASSPALITRRLPFDPTRVLSLTLTSGSTGTPKAVAHNAGAHLASAAGLRAKMPYDAKDCWLLSLPLFHISGLAIVWRWLNAGAQLKIASTKGEDLIAACQGVSHASLVPVQLQRLLAAPSPLDVSAVLLGGSAIADNLMQALTHQGINAWRGYGMTESASTVYLESALDAAAGAVLDHRALDISAHGELLIKGAVLALGYLQQTQIVPLPLTASGWYATKDLGRWQQHRLSVHGRMDNMFICGGENVQPEAVEAVLAHFPQLLQVMIVPVPHPHWGEVPVAIVEGNIDNVAFLAFAREALPPYQRPIQVYPIAERFKANGIKWSRAALTRWAREQI